MGSQLTGVLRPDVEIIQPGKHGDYPMLFDPQSDSYYRISSQTLRVVSHLTVSLPISQFIEKLSGQGVTVTLEDMVHLLAFLHQNNLMAPEPGQTREKYRNLQEAKEKTAFLRFSSSFLFIRFPAWKPEAFFRHMAPYVSWLWSKWFIIAIMIPAILGYILALRDFPKVRDTLLDSICWAGFVKYSLAIVIVKLFHELAHSLAAIGHNCPVRGIGIGLMIFYPRLYTDITDAWRLPRGERLLLDGAGIIAELIIGGLSALLWCYLPPGQLQSTLFYLFAVSAIGTIFANGNPLIRFDGYYILCDLLGIDNLMAQASSCFREYWQRILFHVGTIKPRKHTVFLLLFGASAFIYRIFLNLSIFLLIYHRFLKAAAVILLCLMLYGSLIYPLYNEIRSLRKYSKATGSYAAFVTLTILAVIGVLILFVPVNFSFSLPAEVKPEIIQVLAVDEGGYLTESVSDIPRFVKKGELILQLSSPQLGFAKERLKTVGAMDRAVLEQQLLTPERLAEAELTRRKMQSNDTAISELERRGNALSIKATADGVFIPCIKKASAGRYLSKGTMIGHLHSSHFSIRAYSEDRHLRNITPGMPASIEFPDSLVKLNAYVEEVVPIAVEFGKSPVISPFGGDIPVYPDEKKREGFQPVIPLYTVNFALEKHEAIRPERTVYARIRYRVRLYDYVKRLVLSVIRREV